MAWCGQDGGGEPARTCGGDREAKVPGDDGGEHDDGDDTSNMFTTLERPEEDGSGGVTIADGREERCQGQGTTAMERQKGGRDSEEKN